MSAGLWQSEKFKFTYVNMENGDNTISWYRQRPVNDTNWFIKVGLIKPYLLMRTKGPTGKIKRCSK